MFLSFTNIKRGLAVLECASIADRLVKDKKRGHLRTDKYLGRITPDGLVEPKVARILKRYDQVTVNEYGSSF